MGGAAARLLVGRDRELARVTGLLDDALQWADEASGALLAEVVRRLRGTRIQLSFLISADGDFQAG